MHTDYDSPSTLQAEGMAADSGLHSAFTDYSRRCTSYCNVCATIMIINVMSVKTAPGTSFKYISGSYVTYRNHHNLNDNKH